jgi:Holliday junction resolvase-like predicted endonuclease
MDVAKSTRHAKITGDFGEGLALYWLSKHGFECARIDHAGIDLIARHPTKKILLGISVKSRSRTPGTEATSLLIERAQFERAREVCEKFLCEPYFALVIDAGGKVYLYILPMTILLAQLGGNKTVNWKMSEAAMLTYRRNPEIMCVEMLYSQHSWGALASRLEPTPLQSQIL